MATGVACTLAGTDADAPIHTWRTPFSSYSVMYDPGTAPSGHVETSKRLRPVTWSEWPASVVAETEPKLNPLSWRRLTRSAALRPASVSRSSSSSAVKSPRSVTADATTTPIFSAWLWLRNAFFPVRSTAAWSYSFKHSMNVREPGGFPASAGATMPRTKNLARRPPVDVGPPTAGIASARIGVVVSAARAGAVGAASASVSERPRRRRRPTLPVPDRLAPVRRGRRRAVPRQRLRRLRRLHSSSGRRQRGVGGVPRLQPTALAPLALRHRVAAPRQPAVRLHRAPQHPLSERGVRGAALLRRLRLGLSAPSKRHGRGARGRPPTTTTCGGRKMCDRRGANDPAAPPSPAPALRPRARAQAPTPTHTHPLHSTHPPAHTSTHTQLSAS